MNARIGLIGGTVFYRQGLFNRAEQETVQTEFGPALVILSGRLAYMPRHGLNGGPYIHPHRINHPANLCALKEMGITEVIGVNSTGSLKPSFTPGSIVLPHDYIALFDSQTTARNESLHIIPALSELVRGKLKTAAQKTGIAINDNGVYWQSRGPRLETRAEVKFIANYADVVGMTMGSEASVAQELGLDYASLCSIDNYAHGLVPTSLSVETIRAEAEANAAKILKIVQTYIDL